MKKYRKHATFMSWHVSFLLIGCKEMKGGIALGTRIVLASHGSLAEGMLSAVEMIAGKQEAMCAYGLSTYLNPENVKKQVVAEMSKYDEDQFIILCDIKCGSIHNILVELCSQSRVRLISGMNLALVLTIALSQDKEKAQLLHYVNEAKENLMYFDKETIMNSNLEEDKLW